MFYYSILHQLTNLLRIWKSTQVDFDNLGKNFIKTLETEKEKKRVSELNLLITKLKEILESGIC